MAHATCGPCFFGHSQTTWLGSPQYKQRLFVCQHCFTFFVRGLNIVLSICMGSSFGKVVEGWVGIVGGKFLCVVDVGSWRLSCSCSKSLLSRQTTCAMAWFNVEGFGKVSSKSFTSTCNPNWNWFMNVASPHEISQANCLNFDAYTIAKHDPWQKDHILC